jgi:hypothetical protein
MIYYRDTRKITDQEPKEHFTCKSEGEQATLKDVQIFISSRTEEQQLKESKHNKNWPYYQLQSI